MRTVGEVSELTGVTVRTLHHYDEIGLSSPSDRSEVGYRLYSYEDLQRLQEILVWRALGFSLAEIRALLDDPAHDRGAALRRQRELVERELQRLGATGRALDAALAAHEQGMRPQEETMFEGCDPAEYEDETRARWGNTDAYRESTRRTATYGEAEWREIKTEADQIVSDLAELLKAGEPAAGAPARGLAERHRRHVSRWFYACSPQMHGRLGEMYVADARFARHYEREAKGLAAYARDAVAANGDSQLAAAG